MLNHFPLTRKQKREQSANGVVGTKQLEIVDGQGRLTGKKMWADTTPKGGLNEKARSALEEIKGYANRIVQLRMGLEDASPKKFNIRVCVPISEDDFVYASMKEE